MKEFQSKSEFLKTIDIPRGVADELERLHKVVMNIDAVKPEKDWAIKKIDRIHDLFFQPIAFIGGSENDT